MIFTGCLAVVVEVGDLYLAVVEDGHCAGTDAVGQVTGRWGHQWPETDRCRWREVARKHNIPEVGLLKIANHQLPLHTLMFNIFPKTSTAHFDAYYFS